MAKNKSPAFYEAGSWYHRIKVLQEDGTTKYSKKGGFTTAKDAEESYKSYESSIRMHTGLIISDLPEILHLKIT